MEENEGKNLAQDMKKEVEDNQKTEKYYENVQIELEKIELNNVLLRENKEKQVENGEEKEIVTYDLFIKFNDEDVLIATINEEGKLEPNYDILKDDKYSDEDKKKLGDMLNLLGLQKDEVDLNKLQEKLKDIEAKTKEEIDKEREEKEHNESIKDEAEEEKEDKDKEEEQIDENTNEEEEKEQIAEKKHIATRDIFIIKATSQLYKNYPQLRKDEPNLYFYRDTDGIIKAEYIDKNGQTQESKYFNNSTTHLQEETVSLDKDGTDIKKRKPYQVMTTKGLVEKNKDTQDVRVNIYFDHGQMDFEETRQGTNGEWTGYPLEAKGRDDNAHIVNKLSKTMGKVEPSDISDRYDTVENTGLAEDGVQAPDLSPRKTIERFIDEGYNKKEAIDIYNYMIGEEKLTEDAAKEKVNDEIVERIEKGEKEVEEKDLEDNEKTPWGDAWDRRQRR